MRMISLSFLVLFLSLYAVAVSAETEEPWCEEFNADVSETEKASISCEKGDSLCCTAYSQAQYDECYSDYINNLIP